MILSTGEDSPPLLISNESYAMRKFVNYLAKWTILDAARATFISFVMISIIGACTLMVTERATTFVVPKPKLVDSVIELNNSVKHENHVVIETQDNTGLNFTDAWFTSVSALCVTGLTTQNFSHFSLAGQITVLFLIQLGGLGIIFFTSTIALVLFRGLTDNNSIKSFLAQIVDTDHNFVYDMMKYVILYTAFFELAGFLIMGIYLSIFVDPSLYEYTNPWWWSLFHAISAFNNAGFSLSADNLTAFVTDPTINSVIGVLIIAGGLGYPVLLLIHRSIQKYVFNKQNKSLEEDIENAASPVQSRVAIIGTIGLIIIGGLLTFLIERANFEALGYTGIQQIIISFFQSISTRTAGFNTIDIGALHIGTLFFYCALMFIGANPAGTAGGIKIPTVAVLYAYLRDWFDKPGKDIKIYNSPISRFSVSHAIRLFFFSVIFVFFVVFLLSIFEAEYLITPDSTFNFQKILFEAISAFGTVGLSMGYSGSVTSFSGILSDPSKLLIIITMFFGRLGPLTILESIPFKHDDAHKELSQDVKNAQKVQIG
ncbi:hypothetical protein KC717_02215 [Candidatus Dojkabacteria bacterium]|uniref:TrkH family potassium uptake protein n=1 Tax=Candidatus Dojkabacteria bacterium TaxID=2099670 RepID=A0A955L7H5_9BACT|nr:hypothetical protein [Candidatus Dojkabacteria bacterium]